MGMKTINNKHGEEEMQEDTMVAGKSHTVPAFGITFTEGNDYDNYFGTYKVLSIVSDTHMQVQYVSISHSPVQVGQIVVYSMVIQAETISKEKQRKAIGLKKAGAKKFDGDKDNFTLAYIKEHGNITIDVPPQHQHTFAAHYRRISGCDVNDHLGHGYTPGKNEGWWAVTMRVHLPYDEAVLDKLALPGNGVRVDRGTICVSSNNFVRGLLYAGFRIGKNKDNEKLAGLSLAA